MKLTNNTILITGGTSGIGFEFARQLIARGNTVIVTGRNEDKLQEAKTRLPGVGTFRNDVGQVGTMEAFRDAVLAAHPDLNMLINSAGIMRKINLQTAGRDLTDATREVEINLNGTIWTTLAFLDHLKTMKAAAIVNISSGLAFVPMAISPIYSATKAAIHAYTMSLRAQLSDTRVAVFELAPPGTETPLLHGDFSAEDTAGMAPMPVEKMVAAAIEGIEAERHEIRPGAANLLKVASRVAPEFAFRRVNGSVRRMQAQG